MLTGIWSRGVAMVMACFPLADVTWYVNQSYHLAGGKYALTCLPASPAKICWGTGIWVSHYGTSCLTTIIILYSYVHTLDTNAMQAMWLFNYKPPWAGMKSTFNLHCYIVTWGKRLISFITQPLDYISQLNILIIMSSPTTILHWTFSVALVWAWPTWPH